MHARRPVHSHLLECLFLKLQQLPALLSGRPGPTLQQLE